MTLAPAAAASVRLADMEHHLRSIAPAHEGAWFSACSIEPPNSTVAHALRHGPSTMLRWHPTAKRAANGQHLSVADSLATDSSSTNDSRAIPTVPQRDPKHACRFSPSYRAQHSVQCAAIIQAGGERLSLEDASDTPAIEPPFPLQKYELRTGRNQSCGAWGWFSPKLLETGWNYVYIHANEAADDVTQAHAAGFLEGALTAQQIWEHSQNLFQLIFCQKEKQTAKASPFVRSPNEQPPHTASANIPYTCLRTLSDCT